MRLFLYICVVGAVAVGCATWAPATLARRQPSTGTTTPNAPGGLYVLDWDHPGAAFPPPAAEWDREYRDVGPPNQRIRLSHPAEPVRSGRNSARFRLDKGDPESTPVTCAITDRLT